MAHYDPKTGIRNPEPKEWLAKDWSQGKIADYKPYNFVDGEGVRCSIYVSGCLFACPNCYNRVIQNFNYGIPYTEELEQKILDDLAAPYCQGLTLLGGEPMLNTNILLPLCQKVRERFGHEKDIWSWTGYTWEELLKESEDKKELLQLVDILVDGRYIDALRDLTLHFRGSSNQRIIDVQKSLASGQVILWNHGDYLKSEEKNT
ncbi:anaerobic ribonucleoside-triphosphate reductase activating protein [Allofustis seminis]|uniref:anaerobic ribonucleoside-triphosphate reductase activating protein n=1 Tax=Allofustis seminis TaxID=166939 RepID=UPI00036460F4|nr:anaerobic ribonucleoside-triphosphate reductase activating protein [Allofustis seminis]